MQKSESIKNIATALIIFHVKVDKIKKDAINPFFKNKYASLSNILEVINDPLNESGLSFVQMPSGINELVTILMHSESGEFIQSSYEMRPVKDDPQGRGSCLTYQRRYALSAILGLNIDDDDDANLASVQPKENQNRNDAQKLAMDKLVTDAIGKLTGCKTVADLTALKKSIEPNVAINKIFSTAAMARYNEIKPVFEPA